VADDRQMVQVEVLARIFRKSVETIYRLTKSGVLKTEKVEGKTARMYPFIESIQAYIEYLEDKDAKKNATADAIKEAELYRKELDNRMLEAKVAMAEGRAHDVDDVRRVMNDVMGSFKIHLWGLPQKLHDKYGIDPEEMREDINGLCNMLITYNADAFFSRNADYDEAEVDMDEVDEADEEIAMH